ncbi:MAG: glycosyltransferase family 2 protein [Candidatus Paceibacterota bacterium]
MTSATTPQPFRPDDKQFLRDSHVPYWLVLINTLLAISYFVIIAFWLPYSSGWLFTVLVIGQLYFLWQSLTFLYTVYGKKVHHYKNASFTPPVDIFITVAGEPIETVRGTVLATKAMVYPNFSITILNDGYVAGKDNWQDIERLAYECGISCITRKTPGGAKAGNINNGLRHTHAPFIVVFDADYQPHTDFLTQTMPYCADPNVAYIQTPQFYYNAGLSFITRVAWAQQQLFYGPIVRGKDRLNATTLCGTNMVIRRSALEKIGGMCEESIAEDLATGMFLHQQGWKSIYVPKVLAEGLAPEDFFSYYKQQHRWARGALDIIFRYNLVFCRGLTFRQRILYLSSVSYFLSGIIVIAFALIPLIYLFFGIVPFDVATMTLALIFLPYIITTLYTIQRASNYSFTFGSLAFSISMFNIHLSALASALLRHKSVFAVTSKKALNGNFLYLALPQILYITLAAIAIVVGISREGLSPSIMNNIAWTTIYVSVFIPFIYAAAPAQRRSAINWFKQPFRRWSNRPRRRIQIVHGAPNPSASFASTDQGGRGPHSNS